MSLIGSMPRTASKFLLVEIRVVRRVRAGTELVVMKFLLMTGRVRPAVFCDRPRSLTGQSRHLTCNQKHTTTTTTSYYASFINRILPANYFRILRKD